MDISKLKPGDDNYMAYVGPPMQYDFMGATQFRLLCSLGLRANHCLLDFGCGSLRAGRLFISYLNEQRYFGIEPNKWLIEDAVNHQVGQDMVRIKKPQFNYNSDFLTDVFSVRFDFIIAQSVFSHAGSDLISTALRNFKESLKPDGLIAATFVKGIADSQENGWVYPNCVNYRSSTIKRFAKEAGLFITCIPWYNPRQSWYILARDRKRLPNNAMMGHLTGAVLFDPEFAGSWKTSTKIIKSFSKYMKRNLPRPIKSRLKSLVNKIRNK